MTKLDLLKKYRNLTAEYKGNSQPRNQCFKVNLRQGTANNPAKEYPEKGVMV